MMNGARRVRAVETSGRIAGVFFENLNEVFVICKTDAFRDFIDL